MKSRIFVIASAIALMLLATPVVAAKPTPTLTIVSSGEVIGVGVAATPTPAPKVEYLLPYPGILPDHPLYFLKTLRDKILEVLIVDPQRKAEFYLLQADKRINMALFASEQGKPSLTEQSAAIAEEEMNKTIQTLQAFKASGSQVSGSIIDRLEQSTAKHVEVLQGLLARAADTNKAGLNAALDQVKKLQGQIESLR